MTKLCELVRDNLSRLQKVIGQSELVALDDYACRIEAEALIIEIGADPRNHQVGSSIRWRTDDFDDSTELYTNIIARFFEAPKQKETSKTIGDRVRCELDRIVDLLDCCRTQQVTARDLYHFQRGYNQAYNDYMIPKV